jgi:protein-disulfide isomerase
MINRRQFIERISGLILLSAIPFSANATTGVDVVKIMSFSCSYCYSSESHDERISSAVRAQGGRFVSAPVPTHPEDTGERERVYYAARDISEEFGKKVKAALYRGTQGNGIEMHTFSQTLSWLSQNIGEGLSEQLAQLNQRAYSPEAEAALARAARLAVNAGVDQLPSYILLDGAAILEVVSNPGNSTSMATVRDSVLAALKQQNERSK